MPRTFWAREVVLEGPGTFGREWRSVYGFSSKLRRSLWVDAVRGETGIHREPARATDPDVRSIGRSPDQDVWAATHFDPDLDHGHEPEAVQGNAPFPDDLTE